MSRSVYQLLDIFRFLEKFQSGINGTKLDIAPSIETDPKNFWVKFGHLLLSEELQFLLK